MLTCAKIEAIVCVHIDCAKVLARNSIKVCFVWPTTSCIWTESIIIVECSIAKEQRKLFVTVVVWLYFLTVFLSLFIYAVHTQGLCSCIWNGICCRTKKNSERWLLRKSLSFFFASAQTQNVIMEKMCSWLSVRSVSRVIYTILYKYYIYTIYDARSQTACATNFTFHKIKQ